MRGSPVCYYNKLTFVIVKVAGSELSRPAEVMKGAFIYFVCDETGVLLYLPNRNRANISMVNGRRREAI